MKDLFFSEYLVAILALLCAIFMAVIFLYFFVKEMRLHSNKNFYFIVVADLSFHLYLQEENSNIFLWTNLALSALFAFLAFAPLIRAIFRGEDVRAAEFRFGLQIGLLLLILLASWLLNDSNYFLFCSLIIAASCLHFCFFGWKQENLWFWLLMLGFWVFLFIALGLENSFFIMKISSFIIISGIGSLIIGSTIFLCAVKNY